MEIRELWKLKSAVRGKGRRYLELNANRDFDWEGNRWFVLKMITPNKAFSFEQKKGERLGPEIDHIFPEKPSTTQPLPKNYSAWVEKVWNMQPVKGEINNYKRAKLPKDFFLKHPQYINEYDYLPTKNINDPIWDCNSARKFIEARRKNIITWMNREYALNLKS